MGIWNWIGGFVLFNWLFDHRDQQTKNDITPTQNPQDLTDFGFIINRTNLHDIEDINERLDYIEEELDMIEDELDRIDDETDYY